MHKRVALAASGNKDSNGKSAKKEADNSILLRYPTFSTDGLKEAHHSPIVLYYLLGFTRSHSFS